MWPLPVPSPFLPLPPPSYWPRLLLPLTLLPSPSVLAAAVAFQRRDAVLGDDLDGVFRLHAERGVEAAGEVMLPVFHRRATAREWVS